MVFIRGYIFNIVICLIIGASLAGIYCFFSYKRKKNNRKGGSIVEIIYAYD